MNDLIDEFKKAINDELVHEAYSLAEGGASSYEEYRHRVGIRKGLRKAMQILDDVIEEMTKRDEKF